MKTKYQVKILYKSGAEMTFWVWNFEVFKRRDYSWERVKEEGNPRPLVMGVDDIAAVWVLNEVNVVVYGKEGE